MEQKIIFREMLSEIKELADHKGGRLTVAQIDDFFADAKLTREQLEMIYEYLESQRIQVEGWKREKNPSLFREKATETVEEEITQDEAEEREQTSAMEVYLEELEKIVSLEPAEELELFRKAAAGDLLSKNRLAEAYLPVICEMAGEYEGSEISSEDLIQEGNMGLLLALEELELMDSLAASQAQLLNRVNRHMEKVLREQQEEKNLGDGIVKRVNHLSQAIHNLEEELEHKVSVEELSAYLEMPMEEIRDILKMAGDGLDVEGYEKE